ncbi:unnamed protein product, partial [Effrenium voratum]
MVTRVMSPPAPRSAQESRNHFEIATVMWPDPVTARYAQAYQACFGAVLSLQRFAAVPQIPRETGKAL